MTVKVLYLNPLPDYVEGMRAAAPDDVELTILPLDADRSILLDAAAEADFIVSGIEVPEEVFRAAKRAKFIQYLSSGYGQLPKTTLDELGVPVAQMKTHSISVAEHAVTLMLTLLRRIPTTMPLMHERKWRPDLDETSYAELYQKTVGIVGFGNIGRWVGKIVRHGFDADVVYYDHAEIPLTVAELVGARPVELDELMRTADIVCVNVPYSPEARGLIGADELALMKPSALIINVGRGEIIDEAVLTECLREGRIGGAGLDVFEHEPLDPASELLRLDNVVCTPHMAGVGWENVQRRIATVWQNIDTVRRGGTPRGVITDVKRAP
ncbi:NAD(P)-dependent oxidoreductase [Gulosibacter faecalis]|uniref:NAD(P)-dependent oxidoreductase n=1 Tax=Gulosibacter faecalis TaxID=272240 RepID=A0ABW5UU20_9MICO|nr:NAD(P)-dependent oxidoreductase [Gulosibacter faecalis]